MMSAPPVPPPDLSQNAARPTKILLAEDLDVNRELIRLVLEAQGYQVHDVKDGVGALAAVMADDYDVVLMDLQMPVMDGLQATRALRVLGGWRLDVPVIALSANARAEQIELCLDAGMTAHLAKPFTSQSLCEAVARWSGRSKAAPAAPADAVAPPTSAGQVEQLLELLLTQFDAFTACGAGDRLGLQAMAHALRGSASLFGFKALANASQALEDDCRMSQPLEAPLEATKRLVALARQEITRLLSSDARAAPSDDPQVRDAETSEICGERASSGKS